MNPPKGTKKLTKPPPSPRSTSSSPWVSSCSTSSGVSRTMSFARDRPDSFDLQRFSPTLSTTRPPVLLPPKHTSPDKGMVRSWVSGGGGAVRGRWDEDLIRAKGENEDDSYRVDGWVSEADRYEQRHGRQRLMDEWEYTRRQHQQTSPSQPSTPTQPAHWLTEARAQRLEIFICVFAFLSLFLGAILAYHTIHSQNVRKSKAWHFTIPILSPFTSVVEEESSVIGSKTMAVWGCIAAVLVYFMFRFWIQSPTRSRRK
ncbi:hypothetical protein BDV98DRAFT_606113 [Pterulicium gracile]|uniref:Uncharacterized protein n=1 Tax=Pterulicium gracile TaxID=1884261 RepID=A0A5C3QFG8_9AGAR|nr:hypothetical protein BDV98DRAFT_606113 [Pterula gracilis]